MTEPGTCVQCSAPIRHVLTEGDRRWAIDVTPSPDGTITMVERGGKIRAHVLGGVELPAQGEAFTPHDKTCKATAKTRGPRCRACGLPMDAELARLERWIDHPCCCPEFQRDVAELKAAGRW